MKINYNKVCFLILCGIAIGLSSVLFGFSMFTTYKWLQYASLILTYALGVYVVRVIHKYPLKIKK